MTVSPKRQTRKSISQSRAHKTARQSWMKRMLRLEALEQRQLMASDLTPFHNTLIGTDVNGDFAITPLDALVVINKLNTEGSGSLSNKAAPTDRSELIDVDGDNSLSPLDALMVINSLNNGEGTGELVEVRYKFFSVNADGTAGTELPDPTPNNGVPDAVIGTGERVIVRTQIKDLRSPTPLGVFSAYHDLSFTNADLSATEKLQLQWGEFNQLDIQNNVRGGTFTLRYGTETTGPIAVAFNNGIYSSSGTVANIRNAIQALPSVGAGNVRVNTLTSSTSFRFAINFVGTNSRVNFVNPVVGTNGLNDGNAGAVTIAITGQDDPNPSDDNVARVARNHNLDNGTFEDQTGQIVPVTRYTNGPDGVLKQSATNPETRTMSLLGGFATSGDFLDPSVASSFLNVVDVLFKGAVPGTINFQGNTSPLPLPGQTGDNLGIALYGAQAAYLTSSVVILPQGTITIVDRLTAVTDLQTVAEDSAQTTFNVVSNDLDRFGSSRGVTAVTQPASGGTVSFVDGGANVSFTPSADFNGTAVFTYTVKNNLNDTAVGTVTVTVTPVNDAPRVIGTQFSVSEDPGSANPLVITPLQIFSPGPADEASQVLTLSNIVTSGQTNGTVSIVGGNINFLPNANFFGTAVFQVTGTDTGTGSDPAKSTVATITVTVTPVNDDPVAFSGSLSVVEDGSLILIGAGAPTDLLTSSNPGPGEASSQAVRLVSIQSPTAQGGTITTVGGVTTYRPAANFFGADSFTYRISDNGSPNAEAVGTITINVTSVNDAPVAVNDTGDSARFVVLGIAVANPLAVMRNDNAGPLETNDTIKIKSVTTPSVGTATIEAGNNRILYTPPTGSFNVTATFSYTIEDSAGLTSTANVEVLIIPPVLPFALTDSATIAEDSSAFTIDVIGNDFANDGATKRLESFGQPASGTGSVVLDDRGTPADKSDDRVVYTPPANYFGDAVFTYTMTDSVPTSVPSTATVTVTVTPVNDPPVAADRVADAVEDTVLTIQANTITDGLDRGPGESAQSLTITDVVNLTAGSGSVAVVSGNIVYTPAQDFNGQLLVRYTVTDSGTPGLSASATLTINVAAVNDAPIAVADVETVTPENQAVTIAISSLLANDRPGPANESSQTVSFVALSGAVGTTNGGSVVQVGQNLVYTPASTFNGIDTFSYQISDGQTTLSTANAALTLRVTEVNDAPTATTLTRSVYASVPTVFNLTQDLASMPKGPANESGQTLRVNRIITSPSTKGTVVLNANGTITYTAPLGASGTDTFTYEVIDNGTTNGVAAPLTSIGTFNVQISPFIPSSVRGVVYVDDNGSGTVDTNELKIGGVEVTLTVAETATTPRTSITKMSLADGSYSFDLLPPGAYTVSYAVPMMTTDAPEANSFTRSIVAPGDVNAVYNFAILGVSPGYANILENLASNYNSANPNNRTSGVYAAIGANGRSEWTITRDGFAGDLFQEVVLSDDSRTAYLTAVRGANHAVYTATLNRQQFVQVTDATGAKVVRVLAKSSDLVWQQVSLAAPPPEIKSRAYLDTLDELFAQQSW